VHRSTLEALKDYARSRDKLHPVPRTPWFFVAQRGGRLDGWDVRATFIKLSRQVGLRGQIDHHGPRLHDFRHSFAVQTLLSWYQAGQDVEQKLPLLSTYLGHAHPSDTYWYLSATPELLAEATIRLERALGGTP
jgi:integrase